MAGPEIISFTRTEKYSASLAEEIQQMREDHDFTDFNITIKEQVLHCHKLMLAAHSPVLKAMIKAQMTEARKREVTLDHIELEIMKIILDYMYIGQISFYTEQLMDIINTCNYLQMNGLKERCAEQVPAILKPANVISWMQRGHDLEMVEIKSYCKTIMVESFSEVTSLAEFLDMTFAEVSDYFSETRQSGIAQDEFLKAGMRWTSHKADLHTIHLENLLCQIQLDSCSLESIVDTMETYGEMIVTNLSVHRLLTKAMKQIMIGRSISPSVTHKATILKTATVDKQDREKDAKHNTVQGAQENPDTPHAIKQHSVQEMNEPTDKSAEKELTDAQKKDDAQEGTTEQNAAKDTVKESDTLGTKAKVQEATVEETPEIINQEMASTGQEAKKQNEVHEGKLQNSVQPHKQVTSAKARRRSARKAKKKGQVQELVTQKNSQEMSGEWITQDAMKPNTAEKATMQGTVQAPKQETGQETTQLETPEVVQAPIPQDQGTMKQTHTEQAGKDDTIKSQPKETLVIVGGQIEGVVSPVVWYLNQAKQFLELCKIPVEDLTPDHSACKTPSGFAVTGGEDSDLCIEYCTATNSWTRLRNMLMKRFGHDSICLKGALYVFGGIQSYRAIASVDYLTMENGKWHHGPQILIDTAFPRVADIKGKVYLLDSEDTRHMYELDVEKKHGGRKRHFQINATILPEEQA